MEIGTSFPIEFGDHRCEVFEPTQPSPHGYLVIYLHDVDLAPLTDSPALLRLCETSGLRVISPRTDRSWWTDRIFPPFSTEWTAEQFVVRQVTAYALERWGVQPPRMAVMGAGMGGQGALRIAFKYPDLFPIVAAFSPAVDFHLRLRDGDPALETLYENEEDARQDTPILHIHPLYYPRNIFFCCDPHDTAWHDGAERLAMKLGSLGVPYECELDTPAGQDVSDYNADLAPRAIEFLTERLEAERKRLV